jgi:hypothetical protein
MMSPTLALLAALVSQAPAGALLDAGTAPASAAAEKIGIAVVNPIPSGDVAKDVPAVVAGLMAARLDQSGVFKVVSEDDVKRMIGFEEMRQALACDDQASCLSEVGDALGVPYLLSSTLAKLGQNLVMTVTLIHLEEARVLKREVATYKDIDALLAGLDVQVDRAVATLLYSEQGTLLVTSSEEGATVEVDGKAIGTTPLAEQSIPSGPHRVTVTKEGFIQFQNDVVVQPRLQTVVTANLDPSPAFAAAYAERAGLVRAAAWGTGIGALVAAGAAAGGFTWFLLRSEEFRGDGLHAVDGAGNVSVDGAEYAELSVAFYGGVSAAVAATALAVTSVVLFATGDDPGRYDDAP